MAAPGGRRTKHTVIYLSWEEAAAWEAVRLADSRCAGVDLSRADWLMRLLEPKLHAHAQDTDLPTHVRQRCLAALTALDQASQRLPAHRPGRPPLVY